VFQPFKVEWYQQREVSTQKLFLGGDVTNFVGFASLSIISKLFKPVVFV